MNVQIAGLPAVVAEEACGCGDVGHGAADRHIHAEPRIAWLGHGLLRHQLELVQDERVLVHVEHPVLVGARRRTVEVVRVACGEEAVERDLLDPRRRSGWDRRLGAGRGGAEGLPLHCQQRHERDQTCRGGHRHQIASMYACSRCKAASRPISSWAASTRTGVTRSISHSIATVKPKAQIDEPTTAASWTTKKWELPWSSPSVPV